ncbi:MAG: arylsulfatase [Cyanobacteriota bacterium]|nr:arylsulfatase [Cyanobacteriota bacterium]
MYYRISKFLAIASFSVFAVIGSSSLTEDKQAQSTSSEENKPPNIVLIIADDMGYSDTSMYGGEIDTPNIEALAKAGMLFTRFYTAATCSPTRSMVLSGVDHHQSGLGNMAEFTASNQKGQPGYEGHLNDRVVTIATLLQDAGYHTYMAGKWHLGKEKGLLPSDRGFEKTFALLDGAADHYSKRGYNPARPVASYSSNGEAVELPDNFYSTDYYTDKLIEFVKGDRDSNKPFFMYATYTSPHDPLQAPEEYIQKYLGKYDRGWDELRKERLQRLKELGLVSEDLELPPRWEMVRAWDSLTPEQQKYESKTMAIYAAMIDNFDANVGRLIDYLKEIGEYENTIFVFFSDNGAEGANRSQLERWKVWLEEDGIDNSYENIGLPNSFATLDKGWTQVSSTPLLWFKGKVSEGGIRVPAVFSYSGAIEPGTRSEAFGQVLDLMPTLLDYAGVEYPGTSYEGKEIYPMGGRSLRPMLEGKSDRVYSDSDPVGFELFGYGNSALFQGDWKIVKIIPPWGDGQWKLFNLAQDPRELNDLSPYYPQKLEQMISLYEEYEKEKGVVPTTEVLYK